MNSNETRTLWISIGAGLLAAFMLYSYSQEQKAVYDKKYGATTKVVVARKNINAFEMIDDSKIDIVEKPVHFVEPEALTDPEEVIGKVAAVPIVEKQQVTKQKMLPVSGAYTGLSHEVAVTKRALTIPVDDFRGVARLLKPGDRIDLIAALDYGKGPALRREVKTILQDVVILATGSRVVNNLPLLIRRDQQGRMTQENLEGDTSFNNVTLEVTPSEAQDLIYILTTASGNLYVSLRNPEDRVIARLNPSSIDSVLGKPNPAVISEALQRTPAAEPPAPPRPAKPAGRFRSF